MTPQALLARLKAEGLTPSLKLRLDGNAPPSPETLELMRRHKAELLNFLAEAQNIPRLHWELEALLRAASSDVLPKGMQRLEQGMVFNLATYALTAASSYLLGDREEALKKLWQAHCAWHREVK